MAMYLCINSSVWIFIWCLLMYSFINLYIWVVVSSGQTRPLQYEHLPLDFAFESCHRKFESNSQSDAKTRVLRTFLKKKEKKDKN